MVIFGSREPGVLFQISLFIECYQQHSNKFEPNLLSFQGKPMEDLQVFNQRSLIKHRKTIYFMIKRTTCYVLENNKTKNWRIKRFANMSLTQKNKKKKIKNIRSVSEYFYPFWYLMGNFYHHAKYKSFWTLLTACLIICW